MYYGKSNLHNPEKYAATRRELTTYRNGAIFIALQELDGAIDMAALARDYFKQSPEWLTEKINASKTETQGAFSAEEAGVMADAFRDLAARLTALAAEIDAVKCID